MNVLEVYYMHLCFEKIGQDFDDAQNLKLKDPVSETANDDSSINLLY